MVFKPVWLTVGFFIAGLQTQRHQLVQAVRDEKFDVECERVDDDIRPKNNAPLTEGAEAFEGKSSKWEFQRTTSGGLQKKGPLTGNYIDKKENQKATIKRERDTAIPQIAEVLASELINSVLPGAAATTELVKPMCSDKNIPQPQNWRDVYVASYHNMQFRGILMEDDNVKKYWKNDLHNVYYALVPGGANNLLKAYNERPFCNLKSLKRALIADLLIANNDMHVGNMVLYGDESANPWELSVQAFDFGAAFNMEGNEEKDEQVQLTTKYRGMLIWEKANHLLNYPKTWWKENKEFWTIVKDDLPVAFPESVWATLKTKLTEYYERKDIVAFMRERIFGKGYKRPGVDSEFDEDWQKFKDLMNARITNFKRQATQILEHVDSSTGWWEHQEANEWSDQEGNEGGS